MAKSKEALRLISLEIRNVMRLEAFDMTMGPDGVVVIEAKNGQGKTSALTTLEMALAGMSDAPTEPLRDGAKKGYVIATFDGITVKRVFRASKPPALTVTLPNGTKVKGPQTFLDALFTKRCLRPTRLLEASEKDQVAIAAEIMGFDPSAFSDEIESVFNDRTDANREAKRLAAVVTETTFCEDAPDEEVSVSELMVELKKRQAHNDTIREKRDAVSDASNALDGLKIEREACEATAKAAADAIEAARVALKDAEQEHTDCLADIETSAKAVGRGEANLASCAADHNALTPAETNDITDDIEAADETNAKVRANIERAKAKGVAAEAAKDAGALDAKLTKLKEARTAARLEACDRLSIPGLDLTEDRLLFNGVPFSQAGSADQLRTCVELAIKGNKDKRVRVLLIDDGEKLDAEGVEAVMAAAQKESYQVIMTKVIARTEDASESSVVIEDGTVKA